MQPKELKEVSNDDLTRFNNDYILASGYVASFQNQVVNAIELSAKVIDARRLNPDLIHRPKRTKVLPNVLSKEEVKRILEAPVNIKHRAMFSLIYACGLRCGELLPLKPVHIDSKRSVLSVLQSKGKKDRIMPISQKIIGFLRDYCRACKPTNYVFEGQEKGDPYNARSLQQVLKQSLLKGEIKKTCYASLAQVQLCNALARNGHRLAVYPRAVGPQ